MDGKAVQTVSRKEEVREGYPAPPPKKKEIKIPQAIINITEKLLKTAKLSEA